MGLFNLKNKVKEYVEFEEYSNSIDTLLSMDKYISKKDYVFINESLANTYSKLKIIVEQGMLYEWCKSKKIDYKSFEKLIGKYKNIEKTINLHNTKFIEKHL